MSNKKHHSFIITALLFSCTKPQKACFDFSPANPTIATVVTLNATCSQNTYSFRWTFGDGSADSTTHSATITHQYKTSGIYSVTLNAKRKDGVTLTKGNPTETKTITVQ